MFPKFARLVAHRADPDQTPHFARLILEIGGWYAVCGGRGHIYISSLSALLFTFFLHLCYFSFSSYLLVLITLNPASILYKSIAGRYRHVSYPDGPITARYRFIKNAYWNAYWVFYIPLRDDTN